MLINIKTINYLSTLTIKKVNISKFFVYFESTFFINRKYYIRLNSGCISASLAKKVETNSFFRSVSLNL